MKRSRCGTCYDDRTIGKRRGVYVCRDCARCSDFRWESAREEVVRIETSAKAVKPNPTDCPKCGRHDGGLIAQGLAEPCSSGCFYNAKAVKT